jgi:DNA-binding NarL/FixJ family response regulator
MLSAIADATYHEGRIDEPRRLRPIGVLVYAKDPISRAGVSGQLGGDPGIDLIDPGQGRTADVAVVVAERINDEVLRVIRTINAAGTTGVVVVASLLDTASMMAAIEAGAAGLLLRPLASRERLIGVIIGARQTATPTVPPPGERAAGANDIGRDLTDREREVLRLLADGCDTAEIAGRLAYSEPTIKNVVQRLFERLQARNRPHAVAVALRAGII